MKEAVLVIGNYLAKFCMLMCVNVRERGRRERKENRRGRKGGTGEREIRERDRWREGRKQETWHMNTNMLKQTLGWAEGKDAHNTALSTFFFLFENLKTSRSKRLVFLY